MKISGKKDKRNGRLHRTIIKNIKNIFSRLSRREILLISTLMVMITFGLFYHFVISPSMEKISVLKEQHEEISFQYEMMRRDISQLNPMHKAYKIAYAKAIFLSENMFTNHEQERFILLLDEMLKNANLNYTSISFIQPGIAPIKEKQQMQNQELTLLDEIVEKFTSLNNKSKGIEVEEGIEEDTEDTKNTEDTYENPETEEEDTSQIKKMEIQILYRSKYENVKAFLKSIESLPKKIVVSKLDMAVDEETNDIIGNITINLFYAPTFSEQAQDISWPHQNLYGKENPFRFGPISQGTDEILKKDTTDFIMMAKPITADLPTVILMKANQTDMFTHIYADNAGIEPVELQLLQEGTRYFYKYKTSETSYPQDYDAEKMEFTPEGNTIDVSIISSSRNSDDDDSGLDLKIINKTDLECFVRVEYDDNSRPRVTMNQPFGKVTIIK